LSKDLIQNPITTTIAIVPIHHKIGVPSAKTSRAQLLLPQSDGES
jgi:hypothetical protein